MYRNILAGHISLIQVDATNCFVVEVNTSKGDEISIEAEMEGEYSKDLELEVSTNGSTLIVDTGFAPNFKNPNDKLSAHKVVSILLRLTVPSYKNLDIYGTNVRVVLDGNYNELQVSLADGTCVLNSVVGDADIKTQSGNIKVYSTAAAIDATSKYGAVSINRIPAGNSSFKLQTVTGNIDLFKTE
ncbi:DUF4097 family beta strand repeat-containing protein [Maribacter forsetii]|uniref:DUF4097 family beta strand repeat-containing protein n=1 Tax=Maribacter forsetii TaxID=444515 RepID=UPI000691E08E|nr:DUF4097 family beta strand repeat-containing protein [Maribacter forsetii]